MIRSDDISVFVSLLVSLGNIIVVVSIMGNQCCSDKKVDKEVYDPTKIERPVSAAPFSPQKSNLQVGLEGTER